MSWLRYALISMHLCAFWPLFFNIGWRRHLNKRRPYFFNQYILIWFPMQRRKRYIYNNSYFFHLNPINDFSYLNIQNMFYYLWANCRVISDIVAGINETWYILNFSHCILRPRDTLTLEYFYTLNTFACFSDCLLFISLVLFIIIWH